MNQRFEDLMYHAGLTASGCWDELGVYEKEAIEKFAELIVSECMDCSTWVGKVNKNAKEPIHTARAINQRIKKRFEVEEREDVNQRINKHFGVEKREAKKLALLSEIQFLSAQDMHDENGYPTKHALKIVEIWPFDHNPREYFDFIKSIWHLRSWGWHEGEEPHDYKEGEKVYRYDISTAGWSGNESIIREMEKNYMMWSLNWVQSRRGGHYIFELREFE
jgi:hypothetical protein